MDDSGPRVSPVRSAVIPAQAGIQNPLSGLAVLAGLLVFLGAGCAKTAEPVVEVQQPVKSADMIVLPKSGRLCTGDMDWVNKTFRPGFLKKSNNQNTEAVFRRIFQEVATPASDKNYAALRAQGMNLGEVCLVWNDASLEISFILKESSADPRVPKGEYPPLTDSTSTIVYVNDRDAVFFLSKPYSFVAPFEDGLGNLRTFSQRGTDGILHEGYEASASFYLDDVPSYTQEYVRFDTSDGSTTKISCDVAHKDNSAKCITTKL